MQRLHDQCVVMLSQDSFYRGLTPEECKNIKGKPGAFTHKHGRESDQKHYMMQLTALMSQMPLTQKPWSNAYSH